MWRDLPSSPKYLTVRPQLEEENGIGEADEGGSKEGKDLRVPRVEDGDGRQKEEEQVRDLSGQTVSGRQVVSSEALFNQERHQDVHICVYL